MIIKFSDLIKLICNNLGIDDVKIGDLYMINWIHPFSGTKVGYLGEIVSIDRFITVKIDFGHGNGSLVSSFDREYFRKYCRKIAV